MIAKHVPMNSVKKSNFAELVRYITNEQSKAERVGRISVSNCHSTDPDVAALEVQAKQAQNTRAVSDKIYHLIMSFPAGEEPDDDVLVAIEDHICTGLGYGAHQRVSAVHHDTDNLHVHVAINKIHPTRLTLHDPYYDHKILSALCEKMEIQYGLENDNHKAQRRGGESRAADMENAGGVESLLGWIRRECLSEIHAATTWEALHQVLTNSSLEIRPQGNGLVIADLKGRAVKASSVDRGLSKVKLEARLGVFEPSRESRIHGRRKAYAPNPMRSRINTSELFIKYTEEQKSLGSARAVQWGKAGEKKNRLIDAVKRAGRLRRATIKLMGGSALNKKTLYSLTSKALRAEIQDIHKQYLKERKLVYEAYRRQGWADWLQTKALEGSTEALAALRAREAREPLRGNTVTGDPSPGAVPKVVAVTKARPDSITKKGTIIYSMGGSAVRDDGALFKVSRGATNDALEAALRLATERYGQRISVNGTSEFKEQITQVAAGRGLNIIFSDRALETRRRELLDNPAATIPPLPTRTNLWPLVGEAPELWSSDALEAAEAYATERNDKRVKILDIPKHTRYNKSNAGAVFAYAGIRRRGGHLLALLKRDDVIEVLPVDAATAKRLERIKVGDPVTTTARGSLKTKGRSR